LAFLYSITTPQQESCYNFGTDTERICIDIGASACISTRRKNFVNLTPVKNIKINGIGSGLPVEGSGLLKWPLRDENNNEVDLYIQNALFVPKAPMGLLCPQEVAQQTKKPQDGFNALGQHGILTFNGFCKTVPYDVRSRLLIMYTVDGLQCYMTASSEPSLPPSDSLTASQKLLLRWHCLSHLNFQKLQDLARQGKLPKKILGCSPPLCHSCLFGKAHQRASPSSDAIPHIDSGYLHSGDKVSVDQLESSTPGYVDTFKGKPTKAKYNATSVYVDHASRLIIVKCHFSTGGSEAVEGKTMLEHLAASNGIKVKGYRANNGIMACQEYINHVKINQQNITYCSINAHEQNGIAERGICTLCDRARTMLIHAMEHWPDVVTLDLWPFALRMAADIHNATPGPSGLSPEEIFTQQKSRPDRLLDFHTFGCPVFVLEPSLQQGHKIPKWQPRARQAIYLGHSPRHAQTVPIVLNINKGMCSPQYHVVFDDYFTTTQSRTTNQLPLEWDTLFMHNRINVLDGEEELQRELQLAPEWNETASTRPTLAPPQFMTPIDKIGPTLTDHGASSQPLQDSPAPEGDPSAPEGDPLAPEEAPSAPEGLPVDSNNSADDVSMPPIELSGPRLGWNSSHHHNTRYKAPFQANLSAVVSQHRSMEDILGTNKIQDQFTAMLTTMEQQHCLDDGTLNAIYPCALQNNDMYYGEMLKAPDKTKFVEAMEQEVDGLRDMLQVIPRSSLPEGVKLLPAIWAFKRKRLPDWSIQKYKARLNVHGGKQKHRVNY